MVSVSDDGPLFEAGVKRGLGGKEREGKVGLWEGVLGCSEKKNSLLVLGFTEFK